MTLIRQGDPEPSASMKADEVVVGVDVPVEVAVKQVVPDDLHCVENFDEKKGVINPPTAKKAAWRMKIDNPIRCMRMDQDKRKDEVFPPALNALPNCMEISFKCWPFGCSHFRIFDLHNDYLTPRIGTTISAVMYSEQKQY